MQKSKKRELAANKPKLSEPPLINVLEENDLVDVLAPAAMESGHSEVLLVQSAAARNLDRKFV